MRTLAEAVALLEEADDPAALIASRGIKNPIGTPRSCTCPVAQFLTQETGAEVTVTGVSAYHSSNYYGSRTEFSLKLEAVVRMYDNAERDT